MYLYLKKKMVVGQQDQVHAWSQQHNARQTKVKTHLMNRLLFVI